jgi:hypothetical protein
VKKIVFLVNSDTGRVTGGMRYIYRIAHALYMGGIPTGISSLSATLPAEISGEPFQCKKLTLTESKDLPPNERIFVVPDDLMLRFNSRVQVSNQEICIPDGPYVLLSQNRRDIMKSFMDIWPRRMSGISLANHKNCLGHLTVSARESEIWRVIYPNLAGWTIPNSIDGDVFKPGPKKPLIVYGVKGGADEFEMRALLLLIRHAKLFRGHSFKFLLGLARAELAAELAQATIYLQASQYESFGLLAGEAMAAGCIFAGSDGGSDAAFLRGDWAYRAGPCDTLGLMKALRKLDNDLRQQPEVIEEKRRLGRDFVTTHFRPETQSRLAVATFKDIIARAG